MKRLLISLILTTSCVAQSPITNSFFGLTTLDAGTARSPLLTVGVVRNWDVTSYTHLNWAGLNPARGSINLGSPGSAGTLENWVEWAVTHRQTPIFVLGGTPAWANSSGSAAAPPTNINDWTKWVTAVVTQFKGRIKYYELWNEPNSTQFWTGTNEQMLQLAKAAYPIIHSIDPSAVLTTPTTTGPDTTWINSYLSQPGAPATADVMTFHSYNSVQDHASVEAQYRLIQAYKAVAARHGMGTLPMMSTEGGWGNGTSSYITDPTAQANFLAKYFVIHAMLGVSSTVWYAADSGSEWGALYVSKALNAPGMAYQRVQTWLTGSTMTSHGIDSNGTYYMAMTRPDGTRGLVVWNSTANYPYVVAGYTKTQSLTGTTTAVSGGSVMATTTPQFITGPSLPADKSSTGAGVHHYK